MIESVQSGWERGRGFGAS